MTPRRNGDTRVSHWRAALLVAAFAAVPGVLGAIAPAPGGRSAVPTPAFSRADWTASAVGSIDTDVFGLALGAASCAVRSGDVPNPATLTVIDYSRPSTAKRLWVFDLRARELLYQELVAHGQGSGDNMATTFSNEENTHQSSLGLFATGGSYFGKNGYSLRLNGLEPGVNDRALERAIVIHGAPYVSEAFAEAQGRLGRSWGCPALREAVARDVIDHVKNGNLLFIYYPDKKWLKSSMYLGDCAAARPSAARQPAGR
jgi:hypothetical protein